MVAAMLRLSCFLFRLLLLLLALALLALFAAQQLTALMGATTIADGYRQVVDAAPDWAGRIFSAPWWAPAAAAAVPVLLLLWPAKRRRANLPAETAPSEVEAIEAEPIAFERARKAPAEPYLKEQHIYPGSTKLSMVPEFRAIPVRYVTRAKIFIEYSAYSSEDHEWGGMHRVLVAEIHDQEADEWSVINVELMTSYDDESGRTRWRWAREYDYGPPADEEYLFTIEDHYHGRVVFVGPDQTVHHCYFAIVPGRDGPSEMPNVVSHGLFDFVEEWDAQDREEALTI